MSKKIIITNLIAFTFFVGAFGQNSILTLKFLHYADNKKLCLDSVYKNELNQKFTLENFKYYISNFYLENSKGKKISYSEAFFINEDEETSKEIKLKNIPVDEYISIGFILGVDSLHNCSGAQSGALDPVNGMFWAWNTGYIFLKLEGRSAHSKSPGNVVEYHIGGYKQPSNCIREIKLNLKNNLTFRNNEQSIINIKVNALEILKTPIAIDFKKLSSVVDFRNATIIADNYQDMFTLFE